MTGSTGPNTGPGDKTVTTTVVINPPAPSGPSIRTQPDTAKTPGVPVTTPVLQNDSGDSPGIDPGSVTVATPMRPMMSELLMSCW